LGALLPCLLLLKAQPVSGALQGAISDGHKVNRRASFVKVLCLDLIAGLDVVLPVKIGDDSESPDPSAC
jgi:hypothetical protein